MRITEYLKNLIGNGRGEMLVSLFTPQQAEEQGMGTRLLLAGGAVTVLGVALATAVSAAALLLLAMGVIYYLMTQVLGIKLDFDPRAIMQQAQRYASANNPPN
jgi:hypothetical protein